MNEKYRKYIFFLSIIFVLIGIFFRFYQLNFESYWWDEMFGFWIANPNIPYDKTYYTCPFELVRCRRIDFDDTSIIFYFILKNYYQLFGYNPELGRYVPFFFGALSIPLLGILSYQIKKNNSYLLTILLISVNIYLINYSQETRYYSFIFFTSIINLIFYYKLLSFNPVGSSRVYVFFLFVLFSVFSLTLSPFILIIFFSQIAYCTYAFYVFKNKNYLFFLSIPIILIIYLLLNYDYLFFDLASRKNHFLLPVNWRLIYDLFFPKFFGSLIMGLIYMSVLFFLIIYFRKKIFFISNNYLPLIFILFFSYLIPLTYELFFIPILADRYIIFVLIPIIILISVLIFEIKKKYIRNVLILFILIPTFINHYLEIRFREHIKPEFNNLFNYLKEDETKSLAMLFDSGVNKPSIEIIENYIKSLNVIKKNNFKLFEIYNFPSELKKVWIICYGPFTGFDCRVPSDKGKNWILLDDKKFHLVYAKLFRLKN